MAIFWFFFSIIRRPPVPTPTDTLVPYTTLLRSPHGRTDVRPEDATVDAASEREEGGFGERRGISSCHHGRLFCETSLPSAPSSRSEEHTSELQSLMRHSYAVFCSKKKTTINVISN